MRSTSTSSQEGSKIEGGGVIYRGMGACGLHDTPRIIIWVFTAPFGRELFQLGLCPSRVHRDWGIGKNGNTPPS